MASDMKVVVTSGNPNLDRLRDGAISEELEALDLLDPVLREYVLAQVPRWSSSQQIALLRRAVREFMIELPDPPKEELLMQGSGDTVGVITADCELHQLTAQTDGRFTCLCADASEFMVCVAVFVAKIRAYEQALATAKA